VILSLPPRVGLLTGVPKKPDAVELKLLPTDTEFAKMTYVTATHDALERDIAHVSIVLSGAESRSIHRPEVCLTGQGRTIEGSTIVPVEIAPGRVLQVRDLALSGEFPLADGTARRLRTHYAALVCRPGLQHAKPLRAALARHMRRGASQCQSSLGLCFHYGGRHRGP